MANVVDEPSWWDTATTVEIDTINSGGENTQCSRDSVDLLPYGVGIPAANSASWAAQILPWWQVENIHQVD